MASLQVGRRVACFVAHVEFIGCTCQIHGHLGDIGSQADVVAQRIEEYISDDKSDLSTVELSVDDLCLALFHEDGLWYRARVVSRDGHSLTVLFIDYGNTETVDLANVKQASDFVLAIPALSTACVVSDCIPMNEQTWSEEEMKKVEAMLHSVDFEGEILNQISKEIDNPIYFIKLYKSEEPNIPVFVRSISSASEQLPAMPNLKPGTQHEVFISYIESAKKFWIQLKNNESELNSLMLDVSACFAEDLPSSGDIINPSVGQKCASCFSDDGAFYRGIIQSMQGDSCSVFFVDYGNSEKKTTSEIFNLPNALCQLPMQAIQCTLKSPTAEAEDKLHVFANEEEILARILSMTNDGYVVEIRSLEKDAIKQTPVQPSSAASLPDKSDALWVSYGALHLQTNSVYDICLANVESPGDFSIQLIGNGPSLDTLMQGIDEVAHSYDRLTNCYPGYSCLAKFSDDVWYRGEIVSVAGGKLKVAAVDFGFVKQLQPSQLRNIDSTLKDLPAQSLACSIDFSQTSWTPQECDRFQAVADKSSLIAKVLGRKGNIYELDLYDTQGSTDRHINKEFRQSVPLAKVEPQRSPALAPVQFNRPASSSRPLTSAPRNSDFGKVASPPRPLVKKALPTALPSPEASVGSTITLCITALKFPLLFGQLTHTPIEQVAKLQTDINNFFETKSTGPISDVDVGVVCCTEYLDSGWYRAIITAVQVGQVEVSFADFGDSQMKKPSDLKELPDAYCALPQQCIMCKIQNLPQTSAEKLEQFLVNQKIEVRLLSKENTAFPQFTVEMSSSPANRQILQKLQDGPKQTGRFGGNDTSGGRFQSNSRPEPSRSRSISDQDFGQQDVSVGKTVDVMVTHVQDPGHFQVILDDMSPALDKVMDQLHEHYNKLPAGGDVLTNPRLGQACVTQYSEDKGWYRAKISGLLANGLAEVMFVDYGNNECTSRDSLKIIKPQFMTLPAQAILCSLAGVSANQGFWAPEHTVQFEDLVLEQSFCATFTGRKEESSGEVIYRVQLKDNKGGNINQTFGSKTNTLSNESVSPSSGRTVSSHGPAGTNFKVTVGQGQGHRSGAGGWNDGSDVSGGGGKSFGQNAERGARDARDSIGSDTNRSRDGGRGVGGEKRGFGSNASEDRSGRSSTEGRGFGSRESNSQGSGIGVTNSSRGFEKKASGDDGFRSDTQNKSGGSATGKQTKTEDNWNSNSFQAPGAGLSRGSGDGSRLSSKSRFRGVNGLADEEPEDGFIPLIFEVHENVEVSAVYVQGPDIFWCHVAKNSTDLDSMSEKMNSLYESLPATELSVALPEIGLTCVAKFSQDNQWYRAEVTSFGADGVEVQFVDYGNTEMVLLTSVKQIKPEFLALPAQGLKCGMDGMCPTSRVWNEEAIDKFESLTLDKNLLAKIMSRSSDGTHLVDLENKEEGVFISEKFCSEGYCSLISYKSPSVEKEVVVKSPYTTLELESELDAFVCWIENPGMFWIQSVKGEQRLTDLADNIQGLYSTGKGGSLRVSSIEPGQTVVAQFSEDMAWYRAYVEKVTGEGVKVRFVDYGNCEMVSKDSLRGLLGELKTVPAQAAMCRLKGIRPLVSGSYTADAKDIMESLVKDFAKCKVVDNSESPFVVEVKVNDVDVATELIRAAVVRPEKEPTPPESVGRGKSPSSTRQTTVAKYTSQVSLKEGISVPVYITHTDSVESFWCQLVQYANELDELMQNLENYCTSGSSQTDVFTPGMACGALFSEDQAWYRAKVTDVQGDKVEVHFVDYGNSEIVTTSDVCLLSADLLNLPIQAVHCQLDDASAANCDVDKFSELVMDQEISLQVVGLRDSTAKVNLTLPDGQAVKDQLADQPLMQISTVMSAVQEKIQEMKIQVLRFAFLAQTLPTDSVTVYVSQVNSPSDFYIQLASQEEQLNELMEQVAAAYAEDGGQPIDTVQVGDGCCAKFSEDDTWYRAHVTAVSGDQVTVQFVDYGNSETTSMLSLRQLTADLVQRPMFAISCSLHNIKPVSSDWTTEDTVKFEELTVEQTLSCKLVSSTEVQLSVDGTNVADTLIAQGHAAAAATEAVGDKTNVNNSARCEVTKQQLPSQTVPADPATCYLVNAKSDSFYIQLQCEEHQLTKVTESLQDHCPSSVGLDSSEVVVGRICCARFFEDEAWYRAVVEELTPDGNVIVRFIDYGNTDTISSVKDDLRAISGDSLSDHAYAYRCRFPDMEPLSDVQQELLMVAEKELTVHFLTTAGPVYEVKLFDEDQSDMLVMLQNPSEPLASDSAQEHPADVEEESEEPQVEPPVSQATAQETEAAAESITEEVHEPVVDNTESADLNCSLTISNEEQDYTTTDDVDSSTIDKENLVTSMSALKETSLSVEQRVQVLVSAASSPGKFWVQQEQQTSQLEALLNSMFDFFSSLADEELCVQDVEDGTVVAALFAEDESWYRGKVSVSDSGIQVFFLDHGNTETVTVENLRLLPEEFSQLPVQAIPCCLGGVSAEDGEWSDEAVSMFEELTAEKSFLMDVIEKSDEGVYKVQLLDMGISLTDQLIKSGVGAEPTTPVTVSSRVRQTFPSETDDSIICRLHESLALSTVNKYGYRVKDLTLPEDSIPHHFHVTVIHSPTDFWCQVHDFTYEVLQEQLEESYKNSSESLTNPEQGDQCVVYDDAYYRGYLLAKLDDGDVEVLLVDHGRCVTVSVDDLKVLKPEFTDVPQLAFNCSLVNIESDSVFGEWESNSIAGFHEIIELDTVNHLAAKIDRIEEDVVYVSLTLDRKDIAKNLVDEGYAKYIQKDVPTEEHESESESSESVSGLEDEKTDFSALVLEEDSEHYVVLVDSSNMDRLVFNVLMSDSVRKQLNEDIQTYVEGLEGDGDVSVAMKEGDVCLVKKSTENTWYRGKVECVNEDKYQVFLVDEGWKLYVSETGMLPLPKSLLQIPSHTVICKLTDIEPVIAEGWSEEETDFVQGHYTYQDEEETLGLYVECVIGDCHHVIVSKPGETKSMNALLVELGYAKAELGSTVEQELLTLDSETSFHELSLCRQDSFGDTDSPAETSFEADHSNLTMTDCDTSGHTLSAHSDQEKDDNKMSISVQKEIERLNSMCRDNSHSSPETGSVANGNTNTAELDNNSAEQSIEGSGHKLSAVNTSELDNMSGEQSIAGSSHELCAVDTSELENLVLQLKSTGNDGIYDERSIICKAHQSTVTTSDDGQKDDVTPMLDTVQNVACELDITSLDELIATSFYATDSDTSGLLTTDTSCLDTTADTSYLDTTADTSCFDTTADTSCLDTTADTSYLDTPADTSCFDTTADTSCLNTTADTSGLQTTDTSCLDTTADTSCLDTSYPYTSCFDNTDTSCLDTTADTSCLDTTADTSGLQTTDTSFLDTSSLDTTNISCLDTPDTTDLLTTTSDLLTTDSTKGLDVSETRVNEVTSITPTNDDTGKDVTQENGSNMGSHTSLVSSTGTPSIPTLGDSSPESENEEDLSSDSKLETTGELEEQLVLSLSGSAADEVDIGDLDSNDLLLDSSILSSSSSRDSSFFDTSYDGGDSMSTSCDTARNGDGGAWLSDGRESRTPTVVNPDSRASPCLSPGDTEEPPLVKEEVLDAVEIVVPESTESKIENILEVESRNLDVAKEVGQGSVPETVGKKRKDEDEPVGVIGKKRKEDFSVDYESFKTEDESLQEKTQNDRSLVDKVCESNVSTSPLRKPEVFPFNTETEVSQNIDIVFCKAFSNNLNIEFHGDTIIHSRDEAALVKEEMSGGGDQSLCLDWPEKKDVEEVKSLRDIAQSKLSNSPSLGCLHHSHDLELIGNSNRDNCQQNDAAACQGEGGEIHGSISDILVCDDQQLENSSFLDTTDCSSDFSYRCGDCWVLQGLDREADKGIARDFSAIQGTVLMTEIAGDTEVMKVVQCKDVQQGHDEEKILNKTTAGLKGETLYTEKGTTAKKAEDIYQQMTGGRDRETGLTSAQDVQYSDEASSVPTTDDMEGRSLPNLTTEDQTSVSSFSSFALSGIDGEGQDGQTTSTPVDKTEEEDKSSCTPDLEEDQKIEEEQTEKHNSEDIAVEQDDEGPSEDVAETDDQDRDVGEGNLEAPSLEGDQDTTDVQSSVTTQQQEDTEQSDSGNLADDNYSTSSGTADITTADSGTSVEPNSSTDVSATNSHNSCPTITDDDQPSTVFEVEQDQSAGDNNNTTGKLIETVEDVNKAESAGITQTGTGENDSQDSLEVQLTESVESFKSALDPDDIPQQTESLESFKSASQSPQE